MKKALAIICAVAAVLSLSAAAFADGPSQRQASGFPHQMSGNFGQGQGTEMGGQPPMMDGQRQSGTPAFADFDALLEDGVISQDTYDRIQAYMEENTPEDLPEMNGEAPEMGSRPPMMNGQAPDGEAPADRPERPEFGGEAPEFGGEAREFGGEAPEFDGEAPEFDGEAPEFDGEAPELGDENSFVNGLLNDLLEAEVITQDEYDAMIAALTE